MTCAQAPRPRPTVAQSLASQMRWVPLVTTPGPDGYRVAFAGGNTFETLRHTRDAITAHRIAKTANEATLVALLKAMASARSVRS